MIRQQKKVFKGLYKWLSCESIDLVIKKDIKEEYHREEEINFLPVNLYHERAIRIIKLETEVNLGKQIPLN